MYYEQGMTQLEIGERLRLSRQKVQRLLSHSNDLGIVQISVLPVTGTYPGLEEELERRFSLREAVVVEATNPDHYPTVVREIGAAAADYLLRVVQPHDRIVVSWGGTLQEMVSALSYNPPPPRLHDIEVYQALGGLGDPDTDVHGAEVARRLARALGADAFLLPAPGVAASHLAHDALLADPHISDRLRRMGTANLAFMGIGAPRLDSILVRSGSIVQWSELSELKCKGAVGDVNLHYFDELGRLIPSDLEDRVIGLSLDEIAQIDRVVGVAGGSVKLAAVRGALKGRLVNAIVTDHETARELVGVEHEAH
jgi:DNA-binding transcriptional regulator LsrR (DeoR family)